MKTNNQTHSAKHRVGPNNNNGRHTRPVSPRATGKAALRAYAHGVRYHRKYPSSHEIESPNSAIKQQPQDDGSLKDNRLIRLLPSTQPSHESITKKAGRALTGRAARLVLAAAIGASGSANLAAKAIEARHPSPGSQPGISRTVASLAERAILAFNTVNAGGSGYDSPGGNSIKVAIPSSNGVSVLVQLNSRDSLPGYGGIQVPDPASLEGFSETVTLPNGNSMVTSYEYVDGSWQVSRQAANGRNELREVTTTHGGKTTTEKQRIDQDGSAIILSSETGMPAANNNVLQASTLSTYYLQQAMSSVRTPAQVPHNPAVAI